MTITVTRVHEQKGTTMKTTTARVTKARQATRAIAARVKGSVVKPVQDGPIIAAHAGVKGVVLAYGEDAMFCPYVTEA